MASNRNDFAASVEYGRSAEVSIAGCLMRAGRLVLPVYAYSGLSQDKAPKMQSAGGDGLVTPDLLVAGGGRVYWVEVKRKRRADPTTCRGGRPETGISLRLWNHYRKIKAQTGLLVCFCSYTTRKRRSAAARSAG